MRNLATGLLWLVAALPAQDAAERAAVRAQLAREAVAPPPAELPAWLDRITAMLASPDPEVRDDLAFALLTRWLYRDRIVPVELRRTLLRTFTARLATTAAAPADEVVARSFAALSLSLLAALDNQAPWLTDEEFAGLCEAAVAYLRRERDVRGFDERLGWIHSVAHTADLLKFLARSKRLAPAQQQALLAAIADKLAAVATPLVHGEDERLARVVLSLAARDDFAVDAFAAWARATFAAPPPAEAPTAAGLARAHNRRALLQSVYALLATDERKLDGVQAARDAVHELLRQQLH